MSLGYEKTPSTNPARSWLYSVIALPDRTLALSMEHQRIQFSSSMSISTATSAQSKPYKSESLNNKECGQRRSFSNPNPDPKPALWLETPCWLGTNWFYRNGNTYCCKNCSLRYIVNSMRILTLTRWVISVILTCQILYAYPNQNPLNLGWLQEHNRQNIEEMETHFG